MSLISISIQYFKSPLGELILGAYKDQLCLCDWRYRKSRDRIDNRIKRTLNAEFKLEASNLTENAINQLKEYFAQQREVFDIPIIFCGTSFQKEVWKEIVTIPYGQTFSYAGLSKKLGNESAIRAVAAANGANAISIIVPCHRIIGSDGNLTGYAGGLKAKKGLLELEGAIVNKQLNLFK